MGNILSNLGLISEDGEPVISTAHDLTHNVNIEDQTYFKFGGMIVLAVLLSAIAFFGVKKMFN